MPRIYVTLKGQSDLQTPNCLSFLRRAGWSFLFQNGRWLYGWCSYVLRFSAYLSEEIGFHSSAVNLLAPLVSFVTSEPWEDPEFNLVRVILYLSAC